MAIECEDCNEVLLDFDNPGEVDDEDQFECDRCGKKDDIEDSIKKDDEYLCLSCGDVPADEIICEECGDHCDPTPPRNLCPNCQSTTEEGNQAELVVKLANGNQICSNSKELMAGGYVRILNKHGQVRGAWNSTDWEKDPVVVMDAILRCAENL